jgi:hypothetical protein
VALPTAASRTPHHRAWQPLRRKGNGSTGSEEPRTTVTTVVTKTVKTFAQTVAKPMLVANGGWWSATPRANEPSLFMLIQCHEYSRCFLSAQSWSHAQCQEFRQVALRICSIPQGTYVLEAWYFFVTCREECMLFFRSNSNIPAQH